MTTRGRIMYKKQRLIALGFLALLIFIGVGTSPVLRNEQWWIRWWVCEYADGTKVYNYFRMERTKDYVLRRFNGEPDAGCNYFSVLEGIEQYHCYDSTGAAEMKRLHGPIVSIRKEVPPPHRPPDDEKNFAK
jgi:hypothetical protein